jgi:hypothetical protein
MVRNVWVHVRVRACRTVHAWAAATLVNVNVAVAARRHVAQSIHRSDMTVCAHTVGEASRARTAVRMVRNVWVRGRVRACRAVHAWSAHALIDIHITSTTDTTARESSNTRACERTSRANEGTVAWECWSWAWWRADAGP